MYINLGKHNLEKSSFSKELARIIDSDAKKESTYNKLSVIWSESKWSHSTTKSIRYTYIYTYIYFNYTLVSSCAIKLCCSTSKGQISRHLGSPAEPGSLSLAMSSLLTRHSNNTAVTAITLAVIRVDKKQKVVFNNLNGLFFFFTGYRRYLQVEQNQSDLL